MSDKGEDSTARGGAGRAIGSIIDAIISGAIILGAIVGAIGGGFLGYVRGATISRITGAIIFVIIFFSAMVLAFVYDAPRDGSAFAAVVVGTGVIVVCGLLGYIPQQNRRRHDPRHDR